jgi:hypothetical protein
MAGRPGAYDVVPPRRPRRVADLPPALAAEVQPVLDILRDAPGWKAAANEEALIIEVAEIRPLAWLRHQALRFAATVEDREGRPMRHTMRAFMGWCVGETADRMVAEWEARQREREAARAAGRADQPPHMPEGTEHGKPGPRRPSAPTTPLAARAAHAPARPHVSTGRRTDRRPLWDED